MYNFKRLIEKYTIVKPKKVVVTGSYNQNAGGVWQETQTTMEIDGAITPINEALLDSESATYMTTDKMLYCHEDLNVNDKVQHKGINYTIFQTKDFSDYDPSLRIYVLRVGA